MLKELLRALVTLIPLQILGKPDNTTGAARRVDLAEEGIDSPVAVDDQIEVGAFRQQASDGQQSMAQHCLPRPTLGLEPDSLQQGFFDPPVPPRTLGLWATTLVHVCGTGERDAG